MFLRMIMLAVLVATPVLAAEPVERLLPADAAVVVGVKDFPKLREKWGGHPLRRLWDDEEVKAFFAPLRQKLEGGELDETLREATGRSLDELLSLAKGQVVVAMSDFEKLMAMSRDDKRIYDDSPFIQFIVEVSPDDRQAIEELMAKNVEDSQRGAEAGESFSDETEDYRGQTLHVMRRTAGNESQDRDTWVMAGNLLVFSPVPGPVKAALDRLEGQGGEVLADSANFAPVRDQTAGSDAYLYVDGERFMQAVTADAERQFREEADPNVQAPFTPTGLVRALGGDALRGMCVSLTVGENETDIDLNVFYSERRGIFKALALEEGEDLRPKFVPPGVITTIAMSLNVPKMWEAIKEIVGSVNPVLGAVMNNAMQQAAVQVGVDIEKDLIGTLGVGLVSANAFRPAQAGEEPSLARQDLIVAMALSDPQRFEDSLNTVFQRAGEGGDLFEHRDYQGVTIHTFSQPIHDPEGEETFMSYAILDRYMVISQGSTELLERAIAQMQKGEGGAWDQPIAREALGRLPQEGLVATGYTDFTAAMSGMLGLLKQVQELQQQFGGAAADPEDAWVDWDAVPDQDVTGKYLGPLAAGFYMDDRSLSAKYRLVHRESLR